mgnify:CR=1 FL=1
MGCNGPHLWSGWSKQNNIILFVPNICPLSVDHVLTTCLLYKQCAEDKCKLNYASKITHCNEEKKNEGLLSTLYIYLMVACETNVQMS